MLHFLHHDAAICCMWTFEISLFSATEFVVYVLQNLEHVSKTKNNLWCIYESMTERHFTVLYQLFLGVSWCFPGSFPGRWPKLKHRMPSWKAKSGHLGTWAPGLSGWTSAAWGSWCWAPWGTWAMRGSGEIWCSSVFMILDDSWCRFQTKTIMIQDPRYVHAIPQPFGVICVKPQCAWLCEFLPLCCRWCRIWNHIANYYGITRNLNLQSPDVFVFFVLRQRWPALRSSPVLLSEPELHLFYEQDFAQHAMPNDFRCCFSSFGITSASWFRIWIFLELEHPKISKRQSTTWLSVMIHDVDVADWWWTKRLSNGTAERWRFIFLHFFFWQIND